MRTPLLATMVVHMLLTAGGVAHGGEGGPRRREAQAAGGGGGGDGGDPIGAPGSSSVSRCAIYQHAFEQLLAHFNAAKHRDLDAEHGAALAEACRSG